LFISSEDYKLLQFNIHSLQKRSIKSFTKINTLKKNFFLLVKLAACFNYFSSDSLIVGTIYVKDLRVMVDSKLYFHRHVDYLTFSGTKAVGINSFHNITLIFLLSVKVKNKRNQQIHASILLRDVVLRQAQEQLCSPSCSMQWNMSYLRICSTCVYFFFLFCLPYCAEFITGSVDVDLSRKNIHYYYYYYYYYLFLLYSSVIFATHLAIIRVNL
jgi:hypothetical protein